MTQDTAARANALADRVRSLSCATVRKPVLVYFDIIGICWPIRCLLHLNQVDYELIKVPIDLWIWRAEDGSQPLIESFPNGHVPLYVDEDVRLTESNVISQYLAEKYGLLGDTQTEKLAALEIMSHAYDALFHWSGLFQVNVRLSTPDDVVEARLKAFVGEGAWGLVTDGFRRNLDPFERYLDANPAGDTGFIIGTRLSAADLHAFNTLCNWFKAFDRDRFTREYPRLDAYIQRIGAIPEVADYRRHHQEATTWLPIPPLGLRLTTPGELEGLIGP
ncbi:MAG: glutathione S-transferase family protein [Pseudomonadales bacterium]